MAVENGVPLLVAHLLDDVVPGVAGVVDDDVQSLVLLDGGADKALGKVGVGDIAHAGNGLAAHLAYQGQGLIGGFGIEVVDDQACAFAGQLEGDAAAYAAARS
jgi:hypothetical protein